jgi:O-antigen/teichoic acid export membrane protein
LTVALNWYWIPEYGYLGSAWATLACYASMATVSYLLGQLYYPVAYQVLRILAYIGLGVGLYFANQHRLELVHWSPVLFASVLMLLYLLIVALFEGRKSICPD